LCKNLVEVFDSEIARLELLSCSEDKTISNDALVKLISVNSMKSKILVFLSSFRNEFRNIFKDYYGTSYASSVLPNQFQDSFIKFFGEVE